MIRTVSDILNGFISEERKKLDQFELKHGPTIGKMYEGLTTNILNKSIPPHLDLRLVSGVIYDDTNTMSGEIDCMLVSGEGIPIPYTSSYKWHVKNVLAVFEVKKSLYGSELKDSFFHLREVLSSFGRYIEHGDKEDVFDISSVADTFAEVTSIVLPEHKDIKDLGFSLEMLYHALVMEHLSPIRIVLGYHGYKTEAALRKAMIDFISDNSSGGKGFGVSSFPQLIISDKFSLIKLNGAPYSAPLINEEWIFYASSRSNPVLLILELLWTRLAKLYKLGGLWGEDLEVESFVPLLKGKAVQTTTASGWAYNYYEFNEKELQEFETSYEWEPAYLNTKQFTTINRLCAGEKESIKDPSLISYVESDGQKFEDFIKSILSTNLVGLNGDELELITHHCQCAILPNGKFVAAENDSGRFTRWLMKNIIKKKNA